MKPSDKEFAYKEGFENGQLCAKDDREEGIEPKPVDDSLWRNALYSAIAKLAENDAEFEELEAEFVRGCKDGYR